MEVEGRLQGTGLAHCIDRSQKLLLSVLEILRVEAFGSARLVPENARAAFELELRLERFAPFRKTA